MGMRLAQLIIRIALTSIIARFPGLRLADPDFQPVYMGMFGELYPLSIPMLTQ